jgi:hypothetical protein
VIADDTIQYIKDRRAKIVALKKVLKDMDPASGVAISIRRGVARDNDDVENDAERRPWTTVECINMDWARTVIETAIKVAEDSEKYWLAGASADYQKLGEFLAEEKTKTK